VLGRVRGTGGGVGCVCRQWGVGEGEVVGVQWGRKVCDEGVGGRGRALFHPSHNA